MKPRTEYGKQVMHKLIDMDQNEAWLVCEVQKAMPDMFFHSAMLSRIMHDENYSARHFKREINRILGMGVNQ